MLFTNSDKNNNTVIVINEKGIYFQELAMSDRPKSSVIRIGKLTTVDGSIMANFAEWDNFDSLNHQRLTTEKKIRATKELLIDRWKDLGQTEKIDFEFICDELINLVCDGILKDCKEDLRISQINEIRSSMLALYKTLVNQETELKQIEDAIVIHPLNSITTLGSKVIERVNKLISGASFKHQLKQTKTGDVFFTNLSTLEHFMESAAKELVRTQNEFQISKGLDTGFIDIESAREVISKRYDKATKKLKEKAEKAGIV